MPFVRFWYADRGPFNDSCKEITEVVDRFEKGGNVLLAEECYVFHGLTLLHSLGTTRLTGTRLRLIETEKKFFIQLLKTL